MVVGANCRYMPSLPAFSAPIVSRRSVLTATTAFGAVTGSGCFGAANWFGPDAGDMVIDNDSDERHTVAITVTKVSEDDDDIKPREERPDPETEPIWERTFEVVLASGEDVIEREFVTEPGAFFVEATVDESGWGSGWISLYEATNGIAEDVIYVVVHAIDRIAIYGSHSD